jgi:hypothetical protein
MAHYGLLHDQENTYIGYNGNEWNEDEDLVGLSHFILVHFYLHKFATIATCSMCR